jgi:hypothetical protein
LTKNTSKHSIIELSAGINLANLRKLSKTTYRQLIFRILISLHCITWEPLEKKWEERDWVKLLKTSIRFFRLIRLMLHHSTEED